jgi:hypoxia-inducible factor (prolyl hydroxylase)
MAQAAIVSTQRHVRSTIKSYLRWHLDGAKFSHAFIYFDAPEDDADSIATAQSEEFAGRVTVLEANEAFRLREGYTNLASWSDVCSTVATMVQSRQRLNCEHCLGLCATAGIDWLLHIDADELFMPREDDAGTHFARLSSRGCWQFTYLNLEAIRTAPNAPDRDDYFTSTTVFKQHEDCLPPAALGAAGTEAHTALQYWLERSRARLGLPVWFFFYSNGKSAVRVGPSSERAALKCAGVHGWTRAEEAADGSGWYTNIRKVARRSALRQFDEAEGAVILHYACCTTSGFVSKDWRALGYLGEGCGPWAGRWHAMQAAAAASEGAEDASKDARDGDASAEGTVAEVGEGKAALTVEHSSLFSLEDDVEISRQLKAGVLVRHERVSRYLRGEAAEEPRIDVSGAGHDEASSSSEEEEDLEAKRLRREAHARRQQRRQRWATAGHSLMADGYAIIDGFLGAEAVGSLVAAVVALHGEEEVASPFVLGKTGGGRDGHSATKFAEKAVRGDVVAHLPDAEHSRVPGLATLLRQADELVTTMARGPVPALRRVGSRSNPMLACYPGGGAHYVRHIDNPGGDGDNRRLLTLLVYLNPGWVPADGGMLRIHRPDGSHVDVEPLLDRAVCFWSDARVPHEVLPAQKPRWAVSAWYHHDGTAAAADGNEVGVMHSFGKTTEEIESFLLSMLEMKGGGAKSEPPAKSQAYQDNLRSW